MTIVRLLDEAAIALAVVLGLLAVAGLLLLLHRRIDRLGRTVTSERLQLQQELDRREEYVTSLARELMNPIAAITYASHALMRGTADVLGFAAGIAAEAEGAAGMVRQLGDAARVESRRLRLALAPTDLVGVVREVVRTFDPGPRHRVLLEPMPPRLIVKGDAGAIAKVVRSLLGNSVAYTPACEVTVEVKRGPDGRSAVAAVNDAGPGIPADERPLLFQKFARLSTAGGTAGAGLGLFLSRAIVEEHGGVLSVAWPEQGGSRFWFSLPLEEVAVPD